MKPWRKILVACCSNGAIPMENLREYVNAGIAKLQGFTSSTMQPHHRFFTRTVTNITTTTAITTGTAKARHSFCSSDDGIGEFRVEECE
jgi:hypothetical protein